MIKVRKRRGSRTREPLVHRHLENVSRELLELHPDVVRQFIGRNAGIYALYKKDKLYYVGLATALRHRLKVHLRNRHGTLWDRFSIYLTVKDQHLREIEALLLRIANPPGAKQRGKLAQSKDMRRGIAREIKERQHSKVSSLLGRAALKVASTKSGADSQLLKYFPKGVLIRGKLKTQTFKARILPSGKIRFKGGTYNSLSVAAYNAIKRPTNGWWFWQVEQTRGNWVRLEKIRRAGTVV